MLVIFLSAISNHFRPPWFTEQIISLEFMGVTVPFWRVPLIKAFMTIDWNSFRFETKKEVKSTINHQSQQVGTMKWPSPNRIKFSSFVNFHALVLFFYCIFYLTRCFCSKNPKLANTARFEAAKLGWKKKEKTELSLSRYLKYAWLPLRNHKQQQL